MRGRKPHRYVRLCCLHWRFPHGEKSSFEAPHLFANPSRFFTCVLGFKAGGFLCEVLLPHMVSRSYPRRSCLAKKGPSFPACNQFRMLSDEHVDHVFRLLRITFSAHSQKFMAFLTQSPRGRQDARKTREPRDETAVLVLQRIAFILGASMRLDNYCSRFDCFQM